MDDDLVDDVFEEDDPKNYYQNVNTGLNVNDAPFFDDQTPSPTSRHPAFRNTAAKSNTGPSSEFDDGWSSFKIEDDNGFDESVLHKVGEQRHNQNYSQTFAFTIQMAGRACELLQLAGEGLPSICI